MRGATATSCFHTLNPKDFYSHAPCGARQKVENVFPGKTRFLLTRPLRGATFTAAGSASQRTDFYSHAPCGARPGIYRNRHKRRKFLLTRPLRGATYLSENIEGLLVISTHTPLAGRDSVTTACAAAGAISTHTPLAGRDLGARCHMRGSHISTHTPLAGRDGYTSRRVSDGGISTHTPLAGRDREAQDSRRRAMHFYSHAPCGARLSKNSAKNWAWEFLLTRPLRGATQHETKMFFASEISTHTPLAGRDGEQEEEHHHPCPFLLTRPLRGATRQHSAGPPPCTGISTHTPLAGRDARRRNFYRLRQYFYSHAPCGARLAPVKSSSV